MVSFAGSPVDVLYDGLSVGGEESWKRREAVSAMLSKDPVFDKSNR